MANKQINLVRLVQADGAFDQEARTLLERGREQEARELPVSARDERFWCFSRVKSSAEPSLGQREEATALTMTGSTVKGTETQMRAGS